MGSAHKKVILRRKDGTTLAGYLPTSSLLNRTTRTLDLLDVAGHMIHVPLDVVRYVGFVRDFNLDDEHDPERLMRRTFLARPRTEGLWIRLSFSDGEILEGLAPLDLALLEDAAYDEGVFLIPPDTRSNTQRIYVPRSALSGLQILGVVTTPSKVTRPSGAEKTGRDLGGDLPFFGPGSEF